MSPFLIQAAVALAYGARCLWCQKKQLPRSYLFAGVLPVSLATVVLNVLVPGAFGGHEFTLFAAGGALFGAWHLVAVLKVMNGPSRPDHE